MNTKTKSRSLTRRHFLKSAAATGAVASGFFVNPVRAASPVSPNDKLDIAFVGVGNKGWHTVEQLTSENVVALCDIDANFLNRAAEAFPQAVQYRDYRKMLEAEHNKIDAVVISTADHTHAPATSVALDLGKHVYCEKPLTHTVAEARAVASLAIKNRLTTQMGTQIHASANYRRVVEIVQAGVLGKISQIYTWCNKGWSNGRFASWDQPVPSHVKWDLWLGPARLRPYAPNIHPADWRRFWEYGSGTFGDMACHIMDLPFWAMQLRHPSSVHSEGPELHPDGTPAWVKATYEFPKTPHHDALTLYWSDGNAHFDPVKETKDHEGNSLSSWGLGVLFVGENGMLAADYGRRQLLPRDKAEEFKVPEPTIPDSPGHWREWVDGCKNGTPTTCNFDYAGALTETVLLGIVAFRRGEKIMWDAEQLTAINDADAESLINKSYRSGFEVVGLKPL